MSRRVTAGLTLILLLAGGTLLWWILRGPPTKPPSRQSVPGLSDSVSVEWTDHQTALVDGTTRSDALTALGYVHGMTRPWTITVWRRTALGTLSTTFGDGLTPLDRHARRLGLAHYAQQTYARLPRRTQKRLQAYVRGLNAALQSDRVQERTPFTYFSLSPQRWRPWHPLAVTRLLAWTGTDLSAVPTPDSLERSRFWTSDRRLRRWLHLHGRSRSIGWAARPKTDSAQAVLFGRHTLGATAKPLLQEVTLRLADTEQSVLATLPGTLQAPTGTTGGHAWTTLLTSPVNLTRVALDSSNLQTRHERIRTTSGNELLVEIHHDEDQLLLRPGTRDSTWVLRWPGLRAQDTVPPWSVATVLSPDSSVPDAPEQDSSLFLNTGLTLDASGTWQVQGTPAVMRRGPHFVFIGRSAWAPHQAEALRAQQARESPAPARWSESDSSTWAASLLPRMVPDLAPLAGTDPTVSTALSYLRNWMYVYESSSIGAVLFDKWMRLYRAELGHPPRPNAPAFLAAPRRRQTFRRAVRQLAAQYGSDVRQWRWARVAPTRRHFPVWSADSLIATDLSPLSTTRFAALNRPGRGHASSLSGGPTLMAPSALDSAPSHWDGWMESGRLGLTARRLRFDPSAFFARSLLSRDRPTPVPVKAPPTRTTHLVPAEP